MPFLDLRGEVLTEVVFFFFLSSFFWIVVFSHFSA